MIRQFVNRNMRVNWHGPRGHGGNRNAEQREQNQKQREAANKVIDKLMAEYGNNQEFKQKIEQLAQEYVASGANNRSNKPSWKEQRAVCMRKPEGTINLAPGKTTIIEFEILNDTYGPWKPTCTLALADDCAAPITVNVPILQDVRGKASLTLPVPLTLASNAVADETYNAVLTFRNPKDKPFGHLIPIQVKCVSPSAAL